MLYIYIYPRFDPFLFSMIETMIKMIHKIVRKIVPFPSSEEFTTHTAMISHQK